MNKIIKSSALLAVCTFVWSGSALAADKAGGGRSDSVFHSGEHTQGMESPGRPYSVITGPQKHGSTRWSPKAREQRQQRRQDEYEKKRG